MTAASPGRFPLTEGHAKERWWVFLALGVLLVAFGAFAIAWASLTAVTIAAVWALGVLLLVTGVLEIVTAFTAGRGWGTLLHLFFGVIYVVAGYVMIDRPAESALILTKVLAIFLMVSGAFRVLMAIIERFSHWPLVLLSGVISFLLGLMLYRQWPESGLWFIGLAFGIDMIFSGWHWIFMSVALRRLKRVEG